MLAGIEMEDPVGLTEPDAPQHHCFCLESSRHLFLSMVSPEPDAA
jgi:hypothetical protein